jgi:uncharacterized LabA/DUF88 family protein
MRLFRRKSGTTRAPTEERAAEPPQASSEEPKRSSRRRRGGSKASAPAATPAPLTPQPSEGPAQAKTGRTRRGRRGGARRRAKIAGETGGAGALAALPAAAPAKLQPLDGKRPTTLEELIEAQVTVFRGLQGTLSALEQRLADIGRAGAEQPRLGIFVDVPNIMYAAERMKVRLDYGKLLEFIVRGRELVRASAYAPISDDPQEPLATQKFVQPFIGYGYMLVTKPLKRFADGTIKGNFDVELALDILTMCERLDTVVLVSGDGDFRRVVELVASKGVRVEVVAFSDSTAIELRASADMYIDIKDHLAELRAK